MRYLYFCLPSFLLACASDNEIKIQKREIRTAENTYDIGVISVGDRETAPVILQSVGPGSVTIYDVISSDPEHFVVFPAWADQDSDGDGIADFTVLKGGSKQNPTQDVLEINFRPVANELYRAQITVISDDNTATERTEDGKAIWRFAIRGAGQIPCADVFPKYIDYGKHPPGGYFSEKLSIRNCGEAPLTVASFQVENSSAFFDSSSTPIFVFSGEEKEVEIAWIPGSNNAEYGNLNVTINDPNFPNPIALQGNDCSNTSLDGWDIDGDGWRSCGGDCDDNNPNINPSQPELLNNRDDNCNGQTDEDNLMENDDDGDGFSENDGDCNDSDANIAPNQVEIVNAMDDNCDGIIDNQTEIFDDDGDGFSEREGDCDDNNQAIGPNAEEIENDVDDNCNEFIDEGFSKFDDDGDGITEDEGDCDDTDPWTWPGAIEDCDEVDNDCDGLIDEDDEDNENGACSFIVEREEEIIVTDQGGGCQSYAASKTANKTTTLLGLLLSLAVGYRRKQ